MNESKKSQYKIKGLAVNHPANADFDKYMAQKLAELDIYTEIADKLVGNAETRFVCYKCGRSTWMTNPAIASALRHGWPQCCGETIRFAK